MSLRAAMLQSVLILIVDHWPWFALAYLAWCCGYVLALCRAAKLEDEAWERSARPSGASRGARAGEARWRSAAPSSTQPPVAVHSAETQLH